MFKIKNLFFLIVFIIGCDPSSNSQKKDIDLSKIPFVKPTTKIIFGSGFVLIGFIQLFPLILR